MGREKAGPKKSSRWKERQVYVMQITCSQVTFGKVGDSVKNAKGFK